MFSGTPAEMRASYARQIQRIPRAIYALEVPSIAAVNGPAVGAGCDLALMCDLRVADERASFAESFLRVGLISGDGGAWFLPRVIGRARANEMAFTADPVAAATALEWGMVNSVAPAGKSLEAALELASRIVRHPPQALRLMKRLFRDGPELSLEQTLELSSLMQAAAQHSGDFSEAVTAALEKRAPNFSGR
jgi:enoyl-CoA hydratase/carnithine racemase